MHENTLVFTKDPQAIIVGEEEEMLPWREDNVKDHSWEILWDYFVAESHRPYKLKSNDTIDTLPKWAKPDNLYSFIDTYDKVGKSREYWVDGECHSRDGEEFVKLFEKQLESAKKDGLSVVLVDVHS